MASTASPLSFLLSLSAVAVTAVAGTIGVDYGRDADNLLPPSEVVKLLRREGVTAVKIYDTDHTVLDAFKGSDISLMVGLPNEHLSEANDQSYTDGWVASNILPFYPATRISTIAVGNEVINLPNLVPLLLPAMRNLRSSLKKHNLDGSIKISSPFPFNVLGNSYPPSAGSFRSDLVEPVIKPLLNFLDETSSSLMINIYPYFTYSENSDKIPLDYALFAPTARGITDPHTGLHYSNLFDAQVDAINSAVSSLGGDLLRLDANGGRRHHSVIFPETGWSHGNARHHRMLAASGIGATIDNSATYNRNLVRRVLTGDGTPLNPGQPLEVYIFSLFNENLKKGPDTERNFGLFYPDGTKVYDISLTAGGGQKTMWCVAKGDAPRDKLQQALDYACGKGGVDCRQIQPGGACYEPNTLEAHASWAFNSYYQMKSHAGGTCDFGGVATLTSQQPRGGQKTMWCVAKGDAPSDKLQQALDYACGEGGADCRQIQPGAACYEPNTLEGHASWAFNSYYQMKSQAGGTCDFGGVATLTSQQPRYGNCVFSAASQNCVFFTAS